MAEARRIWSILLPADLHATFSGKCGQRRLTAEVAAALNDLSEQEAIPPLQRPTRDHGTVEITLRLPVAVADRAETWRHQHGLSRQATVEYAVLAALQVAS